VYDDPTLEAQVTALAYADDAATYRLLYRQALLALHREHRRRLNLYATIKSLKDEIARYTAAMVRE
jgi:hypothetical protein